MRGMAGQLRKRVCVSETGVRSAVPSNRRQVCSYRIRYMASWLIASAQCGWLAVQQDFGCAKDICAVNVCVAQPPTKPSLCTCPFALPPFLFALPPHLRFAIFDIPKEKGSGLYAPFRLKLRYVGLSCPRALLHFIVSAKPQ
jgi:hypothetical protein